MINKSSGISEPRIPAPQVTRAILLCEPEKAMYIQQFADNNFDNVTNKFCC